LVVLGKAQANTHDQECLVQLGRYVNGRYSIKVDEGLI